MIDVLGQHEELSLTEMAALFSRCWWGEMCDKPTIRMRRRLVCVVYVIQRTLMSIFPSLLHSFVKSVQRHCLFGKLSFFGGGGGVERKL